MLPKIQSVFLLFYVYYILILFSGSLIALPSGSRTDPYSDTCIRAYESIYDFLNPEITETPPPTTTIRPNKKPTCPKQHGIFPYESDCTKFINCFNWKPRVQKCAFGLMFDRNYLECTDEVECQVESNLVTSIVKPQIKSNLYTPGEMPLAPDNGQRLRLRGETTKGPWEGYLEFRHQKDQRWGHVCVPKDKWTFNEANAVCRHLGFEWGAEQLVYGGLEFGSLPLGFNVTVTKLECVGNELNITDCTIMPGSQCNSANDRVVGVRCYLDPHSLCAEDEFLNGNTCYKIFKDFVTHEKASSICDDADGDLLDIMSQAEHDFVSELLSKLAPSISSVHTYGKVRNVDDGDVIWENIRETVNFTKWWPGWESLNSVKPNISNDNQCIILRNRFPHKEKCALLPSFFWTLDDCDLNGAVVCKKKPRELDCVVGKGVYYQGIINVSETGKPCMRWDNAGVNDYMSKRKSTFVIDETHNIDWAHNYCRNPFGSEHPWCFVSPNVMANCAIRQCPIEKHSNDVENKKLVLSSPELPTECGKRLVDHDGVYDSLSFIHHRSNVDETDESRIRGGVVAKHGAYPWQIGILEENRKGIPFCGGTIISEYFILTAAHCVEDYERHTYIVRVGDFHVNYHEQSEEEFYIDQVIVHESYNASVSWNNDIALLRVKPKQNRGIRFSPYVQPLCLPPVNAPYITDTPCAVYGWGATRQNPFLPDNGALKLRAATVPLIPDDVCKSEPFYGPDRITEGMFCAGYIKGGIDTCSGDSGGGLVCLHNQERPTLMGITSWGEGCGKAYRPGVYARTEYFLPWIHNKLNKFSPMKDAIIGHTNLPSQCGQIFVENNAQRVVNGHEAKYGEYPWQVSITRMGDTWCAATILTENLVLTAAHCMFDHKQIAIPKEEFILRVGDHDKLIKDSEEEEEFLIEEMILHEEYKRSDVKHDIALLRIKPKEKRANQKTGIIFGSRVQPLCLPSSEIQHRAGMNCTISGWGSVNNEDLTITSRTLQAATVPTVADNICRNLYGDALTGGMFCAGHMEGGSDTCSGDSGGPLTCFINGRLTLMGITSFGLDCGQPNKPGVYTKIVNYLPWIHKKLNKVAPVKDTVPRDLPAVSHPKLPSKCGQILVENNAPRIIDGHEAKPGLYPWQVSMSWRGYTWCGATIIAENLVLTAAHCMFDANNNPIPKEEFILRVGDHDTRIKDSEEEEEFLIEELILHEKYKLSKKGYAYNDIALLRTKPKEKRVYGGTGIIFGTRVQPLCLPSSKIPYRVGMNCTISGWGFYNNKDRKTSPTLKAATVLTVADILCSNSYNNSITEGMFCAGHMGGGSDTCGGDSGGPLMCLVDGNPTLMGVTSWGSKNCGEPGKPGVYTRIVHYLPWILSKL